MSTNVIVTEQAVVEGGQTVLEQKTIAAEAVDVINVVIPAAAADKEVDLQPGAAVAVQALMIKANVYSNPGLGYKVHLSTNPMIALDNAQLFVGEGMIDSLGAVPDKLFFTNAGASDAVVSILIARDCTP